MLLYENDESRTICYVSIIIRGAIGAPTASANEGEATVINAETSVQQVQPVLLK